MSFDTDGHRVRYSSIGPGHLLPCADPQFKHGSLMLQVDGGDGQFTGASGVIVSNFLVSDAGEITAQHIGWLFIASSKEVS